MMSEQNDQHEEREHHDHGVGGYLIVFGVLCVLTGLTWFTATQVDFGAMNIVVAICIALLKAAVVLTYFMHLKESPKIITACAVAGFMFVAVLLSFFWADNKGYEIETRAQAWSELGW